MALPNWSTATMTDATAPASASPRPSSPLRARARALTLEELARIPWLQALNPACEVHRLVPLADLAAVHGVKRVINVERYAPGNLIEGFAIQIDHRAAHAQQRAGVRQVFQPRDRRLRTQIALRWSQIMRHLEDWIDAKGIGVVAVLMASRDHQQAETNDVGEPVRDQFGYARINDAGGQTLGNAKTLLNLAQDQNTGIRRQQPAVELGGDPFTGNR